MTKIIPEWITDEIAEVLANLDAIKMETANRQITDLADGSEERLDRVQQFLLKKSGWYKKQEKLKRVI
jgi:hypothetical protein